MIEVIEVSWGLARRGREDMSGGSVRIEVSRPVGFGNRGAKGAENEVTSLYFASGRGFGFGKAVGTEPPTLGRGGGQGTRARRRWSEIVSKRKGVRAAD